MLKQKIDNFNLGRKIILDVYENQKNLKGRCEEIEKQIDNSFAIGFCVQGLYQMARHPIQTIQIAYETYQGIKESQAL